MTRKEKITEIKDIFMRLTKTSDKTELLKINEEISNSLKACKYHPEQHNAAYDLIDYLKSELDEYADKKSKGIVDKAAKNETGIAFYFIVPGVISMATFD